jgi:hypothetical protein
MATVVLTVAFVDKKKRRRRRKPHKRRKAMLIYPKVGTRTVSETADRSSMKHKWGKFMALNKHSQGGDTKPYMKGWASNGPPDT